MDSTWLFPALVSHEGVPLYVLEDRLFRVANWEDQTKEDSASKFRKRREKIADFSPKKTEDKLSLENHKVLSQTNWNIFIFPEKNRKINTSGGTPTWEYGIWQKFSMYYATIY